MNEDWLNLGSLDLFVLDEADKMMSSAFDKDVKFVSLNNLFIFNNRGLTIRISNWITIFKKIWNCYRDSARPRPLQQKNRIFLTLRYK